MDILYSFLLLIPIYLFTFYVLFWEKTFTKRRYICLGIFTLWFVTWYNFPEPTLILSIPLYGIVWYFLLIIWVSFMYWAITGKDPIWFKKIV